MSRRSSFGKKGNELCPRKCPSSLGEGKVFFGNLLYGVPWTNSKTIPIVYSCP